LIVVNGFVSGERRDSYWYDYSSVATGFRSIIADARNWPALDGRSLSGHQADLFRTGDGAGGLADASAAVDADSTYDGRAVVVADLWNRGVLDVVIANQRGPLQIFRNEVAAGRHWIGFDLRGTESNRSAIGAEVRLYRDDIVQLQQVEGGSGFASQRDRRLHFGLGTTARVDSVVIRWPSGGRQTIGAPAADRMHAVTEAR
ncbi:MAG: ASPIC/UnbV domain-containing protein, partial [Gemmatimonadota bacterium]